jgi:hypothetical protein
MRTFQDRAFGQYVSDLGSFHFRCLRTFNAANLVTQAGILPNGGSHPQLARSQSNCKPAIALGAGGSSSDPHGLLFEVSGKGYKVADLLQQHGRA